MKICPICQKKLKITEFGKNAASSTGKDYICRKCKTKRTRQGRIYARTKEVECFCCKKKFFKHPRYVEIKNFCSLYCVHVYCRKGTRAKNGIKKCSKCLIEKTIKEFNKNKRYVDGFNGTCRLCDRKVKAKRIFGLSPEFVTSLSNVCEICGSTNVLCIDHDHITGRVRGMLCKKHNVCLGLFEDNIFHLQKTIEYLKKHQKSALSSAS